MVTTKRCPNCGATNPSSAEWCNQCLERFEAPEPAAPGPSAPEPDVPEPVVAPSMADEERPEEALDALASAEGSATTAASVAATEGTPFKVTEEGIKWTCPMCDNVNALESSICSVCGMRFADIIKPPEERPQRDPGTAALISLFLPGAGHVYLGNWSQGIARAILSVWVLGIVAGGVLVENIPGSAVLSIAFGVAALGLWVAAAHDAYREARGEMGQVLLKGRRFMFVVLGLLFLLVVLIVGSAVGAGS